MHEAGAAQVGHEWSAFLKSITGINGLTWYVDLKQ